MRRAAIVSPIRTGVGKFGGALASIGAGDLGAIVVRALVERTGIDPERIDDVVFAQGYASGEAPCIGRWSALAAGLPEMTPWRAIGWLITRPRVSRSCSVVEPMRAPPRWSVE